MRAYQIYKHLVETNVFKIAEKIKKERKNERSRRK